jgi:hypothetical protein
VDPSSFRVEDKTLILFGLAADEITDIRSSLFLDDSLMDSKSAIEKAFGITDSDRIVEELAKHMVELLTKMASIYGGQEGQEAALDPQYMLACFTRMRGHAKVLHDIEDICRQHMSELESYAKPGEWMYLERPIRRLQS